MSNISDNISISIY